MSIQLIRYGKIFKIPRKIIKYSLSALYPAIIKIWPLPHVKSIDETLDKIIQYKCSISRFGDGEFVYIIDKLSLPFQEYDERLANIMLEALKSNSPKVLIGLPSGYHGLDNLIQESRIMWRSHITWTYPRVKKLLLANKIYYNASFTRFYYEVNNKNDSKRYISKIKKIWEGRQILLVEGEKSRLGVGNDLFDNARSLDRILAPMHHAFRRYDDILSTVKQYEKSYIILLALGPTATALAYQLSFEEYQAIDIGNIDIEYEWFLSGSDKKVKVKGKYTSEAIGGRIVEDVNDEIYNSQIRSKLL